MLYILQFLLVLHSIDYEQSNAPPSTRTIINTGEVISPCNVCLGDNGVAKAIGMGSIVIGVETRGIRNRVRITNVLYMSKLQSNLLLVSTLLSNKLKVQILSTTRK